jgi:hypothetical protein
MLGECKTMETQSQCDQMDMSAPCDPSMTARNTSCCVVSQAPVPTSKSEGSSPSIQEKSEPLDVLAAGLVHFESLDLYGARQYSSPPQQSLLCTFLI